MADPVQRLVAAAKWVLREFDQGYSEEGGSEDPVALEVLARAVKAVDKS